MTRYATQGATVATESHASPAGAAGRSPLLRVSGLSVEFAAEHVLADIDLTINEGELVALAGEPGAGKTTLIRCIAGDLAPDGGRVVLADLGLMGVSDAVQFISTAIVLIAAVTLDSLVRRRSGATAR